MAFHPFHEISHRINELQSSMSSMSKIKEILKFKEAVNVKEREDHQIDFPTKELERNFKEAPITIRNLSFGYGIGDLIFKNMNLTIPSHRVTAIIGRTGSGKTTLSNLLCALYPWPEGEIFYGSYPLTQIPRVLLYEHIGIVTQHLFLFEDTLRENLRLYNTKISDEEIYRVLREVNLENKVLSLQHRLATELSLKSDFFSVGEKQLLVIARMLLKNPSILIFDEATASLDNNTEFLVQQYLKKLFLNRTTIIIAHRLSTIKLADYVIVLERGQVIESGEPADLEKLDGHYSQYMSFLESTELNSK
ncbi:MAG: ATP-binding cassette domain-containing protein [Oligoflexia bacterium]|nr:ATP-binding cassette domain-containing protein [Oligoflexia bacterium]